MASKNDSVRNEKEVLTMSKRSSLLKDVSSETVARTPFVYMERQLVTTMLTRIKLFEKILEVQGSIIECGVYQGNSLLLYSHLSSILEPYNFNRKIIGFDSFGGFRSLSEKDPSSYTEEEFADTDDDHLKKWIELYDENRAVPHISKVELVKGDATETIPNYVENNPHLIVSLLYLDFDIFEPTSVALEHLLPLVPKGGIVGFDEVNAKKWPGETLALKKHLVLNGIKLKKFYFDPWVSFYEVE